MKFLFGSLVSLLFIFSCKPKVVVEENLPVDIALKPVGKTAIEVETQNLETLRSEIEELLASEKCENADDWGYAPMGAKACGGPVQYVAYPKKLKDDILPKIQEYTKKSDDFNKKHQINSDCMMVLPPSGISCVDGKAVLLANPLDEIKAE